MWNLILPGQAPMSEIFRFDINLPEDLSLDSEYHPIALSPNQRILVFAATSGHAASCTYATWTLLRPDLFRARKAAGPRSFHLIVSGWDSLLAVG